MLDFCDLVRRTAAVFTERESEHQFEIATTPAWIEGDAVRLEQIVSNIIGNAVKYTAAGGKITAGRYAVDGLTPGPKVVQVVAVKAVPFARSTEEMAQRAAENKSQGDSSGLIDPADTIPADAAGNNATHDVRPGKQTLNLDLTKPARLTGGSTIPTPDGRHP